MIPTRGKPFNATKTPIQSHLRVWLREQDDTTLRPYLLRRYKNGNLYWSELSYAPAGRAFCLTCMRPHVGRFSAVGPLRDCLVCAAPREWIEVPR